MSVSLFVFLFLHLHNLKAAQPNFTKLCACCLWLWIGPLPMSLWYVMYFRFCGWHHIFMPWTSGPESSTTLCLEEFARWQYQLDVKQLQCLVEFIRMQCWGWSLLPMIALFLLFRYWCAVTVGGRSLPLRVPSYGLSAHTDDAVVTAADISRLHTLGEMQVSSSSTAKTEPPALVPLSSNRTADAAGGRSSGDAASPGLSNSNNVPIIIIIINIIIIICGFLVHLLQHGHKYITAVHENIEYTINRCQWTLKAAVKKCVFGYFLISIWSAMARRFSGSAFHAEGLAYENGCWVNFVCSCGSVKLVVDVEQWLEPMGLTMFVRYIGHVLRHDSRSY